MFCVCTEEPDIGLLTSSAHKGDVLIEKVAHGVQRTPGIAAGESRPKDFGSLVPGEHISRQQASMLSMRRTRTHSATQGDILHNALALPCGPISVPVAASSGITESLEAGARQRKLLQWTRQSYGERAETVVGVLQWYAGVLPILTPGCNFRRLRIVVEAFWVDEQSCGGQGSDWAIEQAAESIAVAGLELLQHVGQDNATDYWSVQAGSAGHYRFEELRLETSVELMNQVYASRLA